jgi:hypothetical protein
MAGDRAVPLAVVECTTSLDRCGVATHIECVMRCDTATESEGGMGGPNVNIKVDPKTQPNLRKLARALIALARQRIEVPPPPPRSPKDGP